VSGGLVIIGSWDRNLYALDAATGRERWRYVTGNDTVIYNQIGIASSAAVANGMVFVGGRDGHFHAVDAATGAFRWKHDNQMGWTIASPAVRDRVVYFPTSDGRRFKALDAATGEVKINLQNKAVSFSSPAIAGNVVFYGSSDGFMNAVRIPDGIVLARFQTDGSRENGPRLLDAEGKIQSALLYPDFTLDGMMIGMRTMMTLGSVLSSPVVADGVVYFGSTDGHLYAVR
jgi:outer membrane protein assembly factor BamB